MANNQVLIFTPGQLIAAHSTRPHTLVEAVAGSGKTRVLLERYRWMVKEQRIHHGEIAIITFTRKAARELSERLEAMELPQPAWIGTVHAWAYDIIKKWVNPNILVVDERENIPQTGNPDIVTAGDQLIYQAGRYLATHDRARTVRHVLYDEVQDSNHADLQFLQALMPDTIFGVGDPNQAIFGFAGRHGEVLDWLKKDKIWKGHGYYTLALNFRSGKAICDTANSILQRIDSNLLLKPGPKRTPQDQDGESDWLDEGNPVEYVQEMAKQGTVALLVPTNKIAQKYAEKLGVKPWTSSTPEGLEFLKRWARIAMATDEQIATNSWLAWSLHIWTDITPHPEQTWKDLRKAKTCQEALAILDLPNLSKDLNLIPNPDMGPQEYQDWYLDRGWLENRGGDEEGRITVSTVHSAKGQEWDGVVLIGKFKWLSEKELYKVLYVAITRARKKLVVINKPTRRGHEVLETR